MGVYGIDINSGQASINIGTVKSANNDFVIVKMGGHNVDAPPGYTAPYYASQIDRCIAASMPKGHYWVIGDHEDESVTQQADYFTSHLHKFDKTKDILGIDNEVFLNENTYFWRDDSISTFVKRVIANLGIDPTQFWVYASTSVWTGGVGPWPKTIATGCRFWVANWGPSPSDGAVHTPNMQGSIPAIDVLQIQDNYAVAGYKVDRNYSTRTIGELFGSWSSSGGGGSTGGGGGGTGTGSGNVLSDQDRVDVKGYMDHSMTSHIDEMTTSTWQHLMASAIDKGNHYIQTYAAWSQRDLEKISSALSGGEPTDVLAKETSSNIVYALNVQKGTKRALTAGQINVLTACGLEYQTVKDGSLAAFAAGPNIPPAASFHSVTTNTVVAFDASASADPDGGPLTYAWRFGDGATGAGRTVSHTYANGQTYSATLTVTDNLGATGVMTKPVPIGTILTQAADGTVAAGSTVTVTPLAAVDYSTATYTQTFGPPVTLNGSGYASRTFTAPAAGSTVDISVKGFAQSGQQVSETQYQFAVN